MMLGWHRVLPGNACMFLQLSRSVLPLFHWIALYCFLSAEISALMLYRTGARLNVHSPAPLLEHKRHANGRVGGRAASS